MNILSGNANTSVITSPESPINYVNKNTSVMVQPMSGGFSLVYPNFMVHPGNTTQSETPIVSHPANKNIMFGSSNAVIVIPLNYSSCESIWQQPDSGRIKMVPL